MASSIVLALGGTRSGKSRYGLATAQRLAGDGRAWFLGTAWHGDPELDDRIRRHRLERPAEWPTVDVGPDLAAAIDSTGPGEPLLLDGFTLWLSAILGDEASPDIDRLLDGPVAEAYEAMRRRPGPVIVVSDEVGLGTVPMHPNTRAYRDLVGIAHQRLASLADEVVLFVAGLPVVLKASGTR
jgi:adenosyl cobinamide kinase/adenosyl cobinamide phosphate guanylyltransferase